MLNPQNVQSEDDISGKSRPQPGRYHAAVNHAAETQSKKKGTPGLEIEFQIICDGLSADGKTPTSGQAGKTIPLFLSAIGSDEAKTKTCLDRMLRLALCVGIMQPQEAAREPDWSEAIGRELVIEVEEQKYEDQQGNEKSGTQVSFLGFWSLGNKKVRDVPKDPTSPGMLALAKGPQSPAPGSTTANVGASANGGNGNGAKAATATTPAAGGKRSWKDIL